MRVKLFPDYYVVHGNCYAVSINSETNAKVTCRLCLIANFALDLSNSITVQQFYHTISEIPFQWLSSI